MTATLLNAGTAPVSATVLTEQIQSRRGAAHLEDVITLAPNVAASSGASRSRFFQIRGIGERSQFVEPVNPSVGILLDGIDLSGAGGALTLFDVRQVEVLRGPQGTLMGANALAGLIAVQSNGTDSDARDVSVGIENKGGYRLGARWGGNLTDSMSGRIAVQQYESDGYVDNDYLNRSDTNSREELTARGTLTWTGNTHTIEAAAYYTRVDNGYDAFSLDNTRATLSDQPGEDDLTLKAGRLNWQSGFLGLDSTLQLSHASTDTTYSYDEDWSYVGIAPGWEYSSYDEYLRDRSMNSLEWRLQAPEADGTEWVIGTYLRDESEDLSRRYTYLPAPFASEIDTQTLAVLRAAQSQLQRATVWLYRRAARATRQRVSRQRGGCERFRPQLLDRPPRADLAVPQRRTALRNVVTGCESRRCQCRVTRQYRCLTGAESGQRRRAGGLRRGDAGEPGARLAA